MAFGFRDAGGTVAGRAVPRRTVVTLRVLQTACGTLLVASLAALGESASAIPVDGGGPTPVASAHPTVPTEWTHTGPLAIPNIGVVPPGLEDWFDPTAERAFVASDAPTSDAAGTTDPPVPTTEEPAPPAPTVPPEEPSIPASPAPTTGAAESPAAASTTTPETTTPQTTTPQTTTPEAPPTGEEPPPPPPPVETNERGNAVLALGQELTVFDDATGAVAFAVAVDSVSTDVACTNPKSAPAENGRFIAVQVRVTTGSDLSAVGGEPGVRSAGFRFLAKDGATLVGAGTPSADSCLRDGESFPSRPLGPDQELTGTVVLDVPKSAGTIVFRPKYLTAGAEWAY
jgi:hypothetical protein